MDHLQASEIQGRPMEWLFKSGETQVILRCVNPRWAKDESKAFWSITGLAIPFRLASMGQLDFTASTDQAHVIAQELAFSNDQLQQSIKAATELHESRVDELLGML